ncbi:MAG TPA: hypothetical protein VH598_01985 [Verrucomicrobiae bacterium]|nr:hypothetical protein [Verrucomicrobiae bacterium]
MKQALWWTAAAFCLVGCASKGWKGYQGRPFQDSVYRGGPQTIPGRVQCAYYDLGGEGVAYHDSDAINHGSGALNPANGEYLNEFRMHEGVDISYTKFKRQTQIDDNPYDLVTPPSNQLYVGWTEPGEWFNLTVNVKRAGRYAVDLLYTSNRGGTISLDCNGKPLTPPINIISTKSNQDPIAWRQWHHWNSLHDVAEVDLPKGISVLTVHILTQGNMNLAFFDFRDK